MSEERVSSVDSVYYQLEKNPRDYRALDSVGSNVLAAAANYIASYAVTKLPPQEAERRTRRDRLKAKVKSVDTSVIDELEAPKELWINRSLVEAYVVFLTLQGLRQEDMKAGWKLKFEGGYSYAIETWEEGLTSYVNPTFRKS